MSVTITRTAWVDDDGSGTTGTVINNAVKTSLYDQIDAAVAAIFSGAQSFTNTTDSTSAITGAIKISGGLGVSKSINAGGAVGANATGTVTSGYGNGLSIAAWDAVGFYNSGVTLAVGGYRGSQWTGVDFFVNGGAELQLRTGGIYAAGAYTATSASGTALYVQSNGQLTRFTSSMRYKHDPQPLKSGLSEVLAMKPFTYLANNEVDGPRHVGASAEDVDALGLTMLVVYDAEGRPDALRYELFTNYLIRAIQELSAEVDEVRSKAGLSTAHAAIVVDDMQRLKAIVYGRGLKSPVTGDAENITAIDMEKRRDKWVYKPEAES